MLSIPNPQSAFDNSSHENRTWMPRPVGGEEKSSLPRGMDRIIRRFGAGGPIGFLVIFVAYGVMRDYFGLAEDGFLVFVRGPIPPGAGMRPLMPRQPALC